MAGAAVRRKQPPEARARDARGGDGRLRVLQPRRTKRRKDPEEDRRKDTVAVCPLCLDHAHDGLDKVTQFKIRWGDTCTGSDEEHF